jgi:hypothetical protein
MTALKNWFEIDLPDRDIREGRLNERKQSQSPYGSE